MRSNPNANRERPGGAPERAAIFAGQDDGGIGGMRPPVAPAAPPVVVDVNEANFEAEIVQRSFEVPVIVDFWATWCGPCKTLSPILEDLAKEAMGQWVLAKVDIDKSRQLAAYFQAQSIPLVVAIYQGNAVHSFTGAQPKAQVERWIAAIFQALRLPFHKPEKEPEPPADPKEAEAFWRKRLVKKGDDDRARLALGRLLMGRSQTQEAQALLDAIPTSAAEFGAAQATLALKDLVVEVGEAGGDQAVRARLSAEPADTEVQYLVAIADGTAGQFAKALDVLVGLVATTKEPLRGRAKKAASLLFEAAGRGDEAVEGLRRKLARLLF